MKQYYALAQEGNAAEITIYGDITSWPWLESDVSAYLLSKRIDAIEADVINVYINSYGGEVSEGLAIYNALKRHRAKVHTYCDGFACSAASVVFMSGEERTMGEASLLMIHNAWTYAQGNAKELRKAADDLETISEASANAYRAAVNIDDKKLAALLDNESWITPEDAVSMGFATGIESYKETAVPAASARLAVMRRLAAHPSEGAGAATLQTDSGLIAAAVVEHIREMLQESPAPEAPAENKVHKFIEALTRRGGTA